ncbi:SDR family NAD(P)-dependent oxidoreductase [Nocardiopsis changdeensis]|uniref:SDR family NAD(P)-dependent oxidoreductase n=1 Tax=Nocardiopsis changdeensis TaxID=2831969 RepID=UPI003F44A03C
MTTDRERFGSGTALVTGGAAGIGAGFAAHLASLGTTVLVADIDIDAAERTAAGIRERGGAASALYLDVTDAAMVDETADRVFAEHGSLELLINNAGVENAGLIWEVDPQRWARVMDINVSGVFHCLRSFVPRMIAAGRPAAIANLSSVGGLSSAPVQAPYIVSKHAVLALTECLHQELALLEAPVQVSAVLPYSVRSEIFRAARREAPGANPLADRVFDAMQEANTAHGLEPVEAARRMTAAIARGDFWVFSDDAVCAQMAADRGDQLIRLAPPPDPRALLDTMGVQR